MQTESTLAGWGRLGVPAREHLGTDLERLTRGANLTRGLGRSYGDSSLPGRAGDRVVCSRLADRLLRFDAEKGLLRAEAGCSLAELNRVLLPRGYFPPVTPGTKYVTLGGMVASDVHGKNHHVRGCFGNFVRGLRVRLASDEVLECSPETHSDLFYGCLGGMGLLGHLLEVEFELEKIPSPWVWMESTRIDSIQDFVDGLKEAAGRFPMTMGWIDCVSSGSSLGRGILMAGDWASKEDAPAGPPEEPSKRSLPFSFPNWALNPFTAARFNDLYYWSHLPRRKRQLVTPDEFFYPLDAVLHWNRAYGTRGFTQYQCVLPRAAGTGAVVEFLRLLAGLGCASPLCVIKDCGPQGRGALSFPLEGTSIAADMAVTPALQRMIDKLDEFVLAAGGRVYLTKDRFTRARNFRAMEPRLDAFQALRDKWDPARRLRSAQSVRLFGDRA